MNLEGVEEFFVSQLLQNFQSIVGRSPTAEDIEKLKPILAVVFTSLSVGNYIQTRYTRLSWSLPRAIEDNMKKQELEFLDCLESKETQLVELAKGPGISFKDIDSIPGHLQTNYVNENIIHDLMVKYPERLLKLRALNRKIKMRYY